MSQRILLVDDNRDFLDSTKDILEMEGYEVVTAGSGEEALQHFSANRFHAILMDIKMPGMNGVESFIAMKKTDPGAKVILITAYPKDNLVSRAAEEGVHAVFTKPLDMEGLLQNISELLGGREDALILVADDDEEFCLNLMDALALEKHRVAIAFDGVEVLRLASEQPSEIILLDMKLPPSNGLEIYRQIRGIRPDATCVIVTGYAQECEELISTALQENAYACLVKPVDMGQLLGILKKINTARRFSIS